MPAERAVQCGSFYKGAAIFSSDSQTFLVEVLEQRTHLAATPLSAYYPLFRGSQWVYNIVDDGKRRTDTETISMQTKRMHGQSVFQRVIDSSDGERGFNYENFSASGQILFHGLGDDSFRLTFSPPIVFPKLARVGERTEIDGKVDAVENSVRLRGPYHAEVRVLGTERVRVAAGTFNCLKVQMTLDFSFKNGNFSGHTIDTQTDWMARGVGSVKWIERNHGETNDNGRRAVQDGLTKSSLSSYSIAPH